MARLTIVGLPSGRELHAGDDLAGVLLDALDDAGVELREGDVLAVASKVVSKVEGATAPLPDGTDVHASRRELARRVARRVVADTPAVLVVETHHGFVCANAGIDTSNVPDGRALLLPDDPDASARRLRQELRRRTGVTVGVVITDTFGRAWRMGQTDVAIGAAGIAPLRDERGGVDRAGRPLDVTVAAVADELAGAADLVRSKADGTPFVLLRGIDASGAGDASALVRPADEDLFRYGGPTAAEELLAAATDASPAGTPRGGEPGPSVDPAVVDRALRAATVGLPRGWLVFRLRPDTAIRLADALDAGPIGADTLLVPVAPSDEHGSHRLAETAGRLVARLGVALADHRATVRWLVRPGDSTEALGSVLGPRPGRALGVLAVAVSSSPPAPATRPWPVEPA